MDLLETGTAALCGMTMYAAPSTRLAAAAPMLTPLRIPAVTVPASAA